MFDQPDTKQDFAEALRSTAMLVTCSISKWNVKINDREAARDLNSMKQAKAGATEVRKNLLAGADESYKKLCSALDMARTSIHYKYTLPWVSIKAGDQKGPRLLPNVYFEKYAASMHAQRQLIETEKATFLGLYPTLVATARPNLGEMGHAHEYPTVEQVARKFDLVLDFQPIPAGTEFRGLPDNLLLALGNHMRDRTETMIKNAIGDVWERTRERVEHLIERLAPVPDGETKRFHASTVENLTEMVELMGGFNIVNDPRITEIQQDIANMLAGVTVDKLREDSNARDTTRARAMQVRDKLGAWGV